MQKKSRSPAKQLDYSNVGFLVFCGELLDPTCWHIDKKNWGLQVYHFKQASTERAIVFGKGKK